MCFEPLKWLVGFKVSYQIGMIDLNHDNSNMHELADFLNFQVLNVQVRISFIVESCTGNYNIQLQHQSQDTILVQLSIHQ